MKRSTVPMEDEEQIMFVQWCQLRKIPLAHIPNEIGGSTPALKVRALKMKRMGTSKGFPDLLVFVPRDNGYKLIAIEMKRRVGSRTSEEQKEWLRRLEKAGVPAAICHGAEEAVEFVEQFMV